MENPRSKFKLLLKQAMTEAKGKVELRKNIDFLSEKENHPQNYEGIFHPPPVVDTPPVVDNSNSSAIFSKGIPQEKPEHTVVTELDNNSETNDGCGISSDVLQVMDESNMNVQEESDGSFQDFSSDDSVKDPMYKRDNTSSSSSSASSTNSSSSSESSSEEEIEDERDRERHSERDEERDRERYSERDEESGAERDEERGAEEDEERGAERDEERGAERDGERGAERDEERDVDVEVREDESNSNIVTETMKRGRKRKANPSGSIKETAKRLRNAGKSYISNSKRNKILVPEKKIGPPCTDRCKHKCYAKVTEEQRHNIFLTYWQLGDLQRQREFLSSNIIAIEPKYTYRKPDSHCAGKNAFYFVVDYKKIRVCKPFFRSTLGINDRPIRTVLSKRSNPIGGFVSLDHRGKHGNHKKLDNTIKDGIRYHIDSIPRIESHYCRADTTRAFIDGGKSVAELHRDYVNDCIRKNVPYGNYVMYHRIFCTEFNIAFFTPKKDQCEDCTSYLNADLETKQQLKSSYDDHLKEKTMSRLEKEKDKNNDDPSCIVAVYDLQGTLPCPRGDVSNFYYVSKINTLNFTIYNLKNKEVHCFVWHEGEGNRGVNEIGSCIYNYLEILNQNASSGRMLDVIFFSDNCCGQQKNHFMIALYLYAVSKFQFLNSITHKFLIKGHTQNEGDSVHSVIERKIKRSLKSGPIYTPDQYVNLIRGTKENRIPYKVHEFAHDSFYDIKSLAPEIGNNYSKNTDNETFKLSNAKIVRVEKEHPAVFFYKNSYSDPEFKKVEVEKNNRRSSKKNTNSNRTAGSLKQMYNRNLPISEKKKKGLMDLIKKNIIPKFYEGFYNSL